MDKSPKRSLYARLRSRLADAPEIEGLTFMQKLEVGLLMGLLENHAVFSECQVEKEELAKTFERMSGRLHITGALSAFSAGIEGLVESLVTDPEIHQMITDSDEDASMSSLARLAHELWRRLDGLQQAGW